MSAWTKSSLSSNATRVMITHKPSEAGMNIGVAESFNPAIVPNARSCMTYSIKILDTRAFLAGMTYASGSVNANDAPSLVSSNQIDPPCASTKPLQMASPRPAPLVRV